MQDYFVGQTGKGCLMTPVLVGSVMTRPVCWRETRGGDGKGKLAALDQQSFIEAINSIGATKQYAYKHTAGRISSARPKGQDEVCRLYNI